MYLASVIMQSGEIIDSSIANSKSIVIIVSLVLGLTYFTIVVVALFHPDTHRRADARSMLKNHRLARNTKKIKG